MDDNTHGAHVARALPPWRPERNLFGDIEVSVNYLHEVSGRMSWASVSPERLLELMDNGLLDFQRDPSVGRPEHVPTREQLVEFLEYERARRAAGQDSASRSYAAAFAGKLGPPKGWRPSAAGLKQSGAGEESDPDPNAVFGPLAPKRGRGGFPAQKASKGEKMEALREARARLVARHKRLRIGALAAEASEVLHGVLKPASLQAFIYTDLSPEEREALLKPL